jgi:cell division septation protein DedD
MSAERKKLLWISISACVFVLLVLATGFFLLTPKKGSAQAPATIGNSAPPKAQDPQDYLSAPPASPSLEQPKSQDGNVIVVYGDKPALPAATTSSSAAGAAPQAEPPAVEGAADGKAAAAPDKGASSAARPAPAVSAKKTPNAKNSSTGSASAKSAANKIPAKPVAVNRADQYWIQAGSFESRGRADELKQSLADKGMAALITVKDVSGKSLYRVRIGPYASEPEAKDWLTKIKGLDGCSAAYVLNSSAKKAK